MAIPLFRAADLRQQGNGLTKLSGFNLILRVSCLMIFLNPSVCLLLLKFIGPLTSKAYCKKKYS